MSVIHIISDQEILNIVGLVEDDLSTDSSSDMWAQRSRFVVRDC